MFDLSHFSYPPSPLWVGCFVSEVSCVFANKTQPCKYSDGIRNNARALPGCGERAKPRGLMVGRFHCQGASSPLSK